MARENRTNRNRAAPILAVAWLLLLFVPAPFAAAQDRSVEQQLRQFKTVLWPRAYRNQDVELLDRQLHESFQLIDAEGNRSSKQDELEWVKNNRWDPGRFEYRIERLDIYDNGRTAIIAGTGEAENYSYRSSNVLIMENGAWKAIASHVSGYRQK